MFIKSIVKTDLKSGKQYKYYRLCQSYRIGNKTRHRNILTLGTLDELPDKQSHKLLADRIEQLLLGSLEIGIFPSDSIIEELAHGFYKTIIEKKLIDLPRIKEKHKENNAEDKNGLDPDYQLIDINSIDHKEVREIGAGWLCYQAIQQLGLPEFLESQNWDSLSIRKGLLDLVSRCIFPESEHKTENWLKNNSGVNELFGFEPGAINRHHLYSMSQKWYKIKEATENYLSRKTNELFDLEDTIILYDLTNTYFEGRKINSQIAFFGNSKEKRKDARLAALGLVVNIEGFVKYSRIYRGNISDCKTLEQTVTDLSVRSSFTRRKPVIVMDAGIATQENLSMLKEKGYSYLCVSRSNINDYQEILKHKPVVSLTDKRKSLIEIIQFTQAENQDNYLYVRSEKKAVKEVSMKEYFTSHFEEGLQQIKQGIHSKWGTKKLVKVYERLGRLKEKYPSGVRFFEIEVKADGNNILATDLVWKKKIPKTQQDEGVYFLRTNIQNTTETEFWQIYNAIREIESCFRILKTDLNLRPVFHKNDETMQAHLNLAILAYQVVNTIRYQLKTKNITYDWSNIVRLMDTQHSVTSTMCNKQGEKITIRKCSNPIKEVKEIYEALKYKQQPYVKKSVLPEK
jgi:hypothetical protein